MGRQQNNPQTDSATGREEKPFEEVVFEGELSVLAKGGVLPRNPSAPATRRATKLECNLALRFGPAKPVVGGERRDSWHKDEADVSAVGGRRRRRRSKFRRCGRG